MQLLCFAAYDVMCKFCCLNDRDLQKALKITVTYNVMCIKICPIEMAAFIGNNLSYFCYIHKWAPCYTCNQKVGLLTCACK